MTSMLIILVSLAAGGGTLWGGINLVDTLHTTESELLLYDLKAHTFATAQFNTLKLQISASDTLNRCRYLESQIRQLKDSIYIRKRDEADALYIRELEKQLEALQEDYDVLNCGFLLA